MTFHKNREDLTGKIFGDWTVLNAAPTPKYGHTRWFCQCKCGAICIVLSINLKRCFSTNCNQCAIFKKSKHRMSNSKTYSTYLQMIERCHRETHNSYHNYGGRGITVCQRWRESFFNFLEDMGEKPEGMSIERIDNDQGYSKANCKWSTWKEQCRNKRNSIRDGDVYNDWIVSNKIHNEKKYLMECMFCKRERIVWSCNVRKLRNCICRKKDNINENI